MLRKLLPVVAAALLLPGLLSADTVVLKDGRRFETAGPYTIQGGVLKFEGRDSIKYEFPVEAVDLEASKQASVKAKPKVWTNDDIEALKGGVAVVGSASAPAAAEAPAEGTAPAAGEAEAKAAEEKREPLPPKEQTQEYWQGRLQPLRDQLQQIDQQISDLRRGETQAASNAINMAGGNPGVQVQDTIDRLERRRREIQQQISDIQDEARRLGISPSWVR
jgi:hypothetical protein